MSMAKEAAARIKINKLLEAAGWQLFEEGGKPANMSLEPSIALRSLVAANREPIICFEQKPQATLSRIWCDDASEAFKCHQRH